MDQQLQYQYGAARRDVCPLCDSECSVIVENLPGYQKPDVFDIMRCAFCDTHFSHPLSSPSGLYEIIYENAQIIPGYDRYYRYASACESSRDPLGYLASRENVYWFVSDVLGKRVKKETSLILEIGSGLGYLTYAVSKAGYNIKGVDISQEAVDRASARFGDLYLQANLFELAEKTPAKYDVVIMTEVIEHVERPLDFVRALRKLVKPDGLLVLTTPNKSSKSQYASWSSDVPPVHLWWFSETSVRQIAKKCDLNIEFWDFTAFNIGENPEKRQFERPASSPIIDEDGNIIRRSSEIQRSKKFNLKSIVRSILKDTKALRVASAVKSALGKGIVYNVADERSSVMGIVLTAS